MLCPLGPVLSPTPRSAINQSLSRGTVTSTRTSDPCARIREQSGPTILQGNPPEPLGRAATTWKLPFAPCLSLQSPEQLDMGPERALSLQRGGGLALGERRRERTNEPDGERGPCSFCSQGQGNPSKVPRPRNSHVLNEAANPLGMSENLLSASFKLFAKLLCADSTRRTAQFH